MKRLRTSGIINFYRRHCFRRNKWTTAALLAETVFSRICRYSFTLLLASFVITVRARLRFHASVLYADIHADAHTRAESYRIAFSFLQHACSHASAAPCGMWYVQLRHKEQSHASFIYYSRGHAASRRVMPPSPCRLAFAIAHPPSLFVPPRLFSPLSSRVVLLFSSFFFSPLFSLLVLFRELNISRESRAFRKTSPPPHAHVETRAAISSARQDLLAQYLPPPFSRGHSRNCSPSSVIKLNFLAAWLLPRDRLSFNSSTTAAGL